MLSGLGGPALVLVFCASQAFRDVFFANVFQGVDFFVVILLAFAPATALFAVLILVGRREELRLMRHATRAILWMNVLTAVAWTSYFFSLAYLQPSIVNTLHAGAGPLTVVALSRCGINIAPPGRTRRGEYVCYAGIAAAMILLWWVVLADRSGLAPVHPLITFASLALPIISGTAITVSSLWAKHLNERGVGAEGVSAVRYLLIVAIAAVVVATGSRPSGIAAAGELAVLGIAAAALIVLPLYAFQLGIARTSPLTVNAVRALGPVAIFALELLDGRVSYSAPVLGAIALYSGFAIATNVVRGWQGEPGRRAAAARA